jgi:hypothetical protein
MVCLPALAGGTIVTDHGGLWRTRSSGVRGEPIAQERGSHERH